MNKLWLVLVFFLVSAISMAGTLSIITGGTQVGTYPVEVSGQYLKSPSGNRAEVTEEGQLQVTMEDSVDTTTDSIKVVDYAHSELHLGRHFQVTNTTLLAKNGTYDILIVASDTLRWAHTIFGVETNDAAIVVSLHEGITYSASGTAAVEINRNRNSVYTAGLAVSYTPTITATGTLVYRKALGSGKNNGGSARDNAELILKQNTAYLLRITEGNVAATNINWEIDWYEHTNK